MALELELISPFEVAKDFVLSVQEYVLLSAQSVLNFFRLPSTWETCFSRPT